jgi:DNA-binding transcriptional LysR family regulator
MPSPETLSDLAVFVAVVKCGSFTAAAHALELAKSQVSKCVNRLEARLGARLLHRTTRRLRLTEAGTAIYETSQGALQAIEDAQLAVSNLQGAPRGKLKVSASIAFGSTQLPRVVARLTEQYPDLAVELLLEDRHIDLVREGIDVAMRITGEPPDSGLVYRRLGPNRQVVCASPRYLERRGVPHAPRDLAAHDCIAHTQRTTPRTWHFTAPGRGKTSVDINGRIAISSALGVRQAALEGLGVVELNSYPGGARHQGRPAGSPACALRAEAAIGVCGLSAAALPRAQGARLHRCDARAHDTRAGMGRLPARPASSCAEPFDRLTLPSSASPRGPGSTPSSRRSPGAGFR